MIRVLLSRCLGLVLFCSSLPSQAQTSQTTSGGLDSQLIKSTVEQVGETVNREYFDADLAARMNLSLKQWLVPNGRLRTAVRSSNWEGPGVIPDVAVSAAAALRIAHQHALRQLLSTTPGGSWHQQLEREIQKLEARPETH
jgi:hypothetical protein